MSAITSINSGGLVTYSVKVNGSAISDSTEIVDITIENHVNRIPRAVITILDGNASEGAFNASASDDFVPGKTITIEAGYDTKNNLIFSGIITGQRLRVDPIHGSALEVECHDQTVKLTVGRKNNVYQDQKDSDVLSSIIGNYSGLTAHVSATEVTYPKQVQYDTTDWDFLVARAEMNGMIVQIKDGKVTISKPDTNTSPVLSITYGDNLYEFEATLDAVSQVSKVKASAWDYTQQKTDSAETSTIYKGPGNLSSKTLADVVGLDHYDIQSTAPLHNDVLQSWSKATMIKSNYAKIRGNTKIQGTHLLSPGTYVTLKGLGARFNGDHIVSAVRHDISDGNWFTEIAIGLSPEWFTEDVNISAPAASGLLPGVQGLQNGTVKQIDQDPDGQYRVLIDLPLVDSSGNGIWARLSNLYASSGAGSFFMPEIGDEVIVGFLNEDPRYPIILGSLYSDKKHKPAEGFEPNNKNNLKGIVTRSGIRLIFDDDDKVITLETPSKNLITLSDADQTISIKDQNNNAIEMSSSGIDIKSATHLNIETVETLSLKGEQGVNIESSTGSIKIDGMDISISADTQFSASANASASLSAGGETSINGAMVMIN